MNTGQIISGAGHLGLIVWALFGNLLASEPIPFDVTEVTAVSQEQFDAVMAAQTPPDTAAEVAAPQAPEVPQEAPDLGSQVDSTPEQPAPDSAETASPDAAPELTQTAPPADAEVSDEPPVLEPPQQDTAALLPETSRRPKPRPAERVAPEAVAPPAPDTTVDDIERQEVRPDESAEREAEESEATAPEEAATEIVTEAEQAAPSKSVRPRARPARAPTSEEPQEPQETQTAEETPPEEQPAETSGVNAALAEALGGKPEAPASSGPPLNAGEIAALHAAVGKCWSVDPGSAAAQVQVTLLVSLNEEGRLTASPDLVSTTDGDPAAVRAAVRAANTAVISCGRKGFDLPADKYDQWKTIEMIFNPEKMRIK